MKFTNFLEWVADKFDTSAPQPQVYDAPVEVHIPNAPMSDETNNRYGDVIQNHFQRSAREFMLPRATRTGMDAVEKFAMDSDLKLNSVGFGTIPDDILGFFASNYFIGYQNCATLAQNPFIDKACGIAIEDAMRKGWELSINSGEKVDAKKIARIKYLDKQYKIDKNLYEFGYFSRVFGIRIAIFEVESTDKKYYEKPFNIDSVKPGSYKGISQVDPYWITPQLDSVDVSDPANKSFYEPTWWRIGGRLFHRSHLVITRYAEVSDILKPTYQYGGMSLPQQIFERVWAAERISNEAPRLVLSKRLRVFGIDLAAAAAKPGEFEARANALVKFQNNFGAQYVDREDQVNQFDTALADVDTMMMSQFQLVSAIAKIPAVKLMGTSPKGFNATGEHEESSYHENLESIQKKTLTPLLERHYQLLLRSEMPDLVSKDLDIDIVWIPPDSTTKKGKADTNYLKAQTDQILIQAGALDPNDVRNRLISDPDSGYNGIEEWSEEKAQMELEQHQEILSGYGQNEDENKE